jgi:hypothetical protein
MGEAALDRSRVALFIPPELKAFKLDLFNRIGRHIEAGGGQVIRNDHTRLPDLPPDIVPIVGCAPQLTGMIAEWRATGRTFIYWDRGYARRIFATDLPRGENGGYYRWHLNAYQMRAIRDRPDDRWRRLKTEVWPWARDGRHIVVAEPSPTYQRFHAIEGWTWATVEALKQVTDRHIVIRTKEMQRFGRRLHEDLRGAHCLVTHGSNAAVEAVIMGCPVVVHPDSAAALVGLTDLRLVESPVYPERRRWLNSLAYSQFDERELCDGTLWRLIE